MLLDTNTLDRKFSVLEMLQIAQSLDVGTTDLGMTPNGEYERGVTELIGRLLLDVGGIGEGTHENSVLILEALENQIF